MTCRQPVPEYLTSTLAVVSSRTARQVLHQRRAHCLYNAEDIVQGVAHYLLCAFRSCRECSAKGGSLTSASPGAPCCQGLGRLCVIAARRAPQQAHGAGEKRACALLQARKGDVATFLDKAGKAYLRGTSSVLSCNNGRQRLLLLFNRLKITRGNGEKCAPHFWGSSARFSADAILPSIPTALPPLSRTGNGIEWYGCLHA